MHCSVQQCVSPLVFECHDGQICYCIVVLVVVPYCLYFYCGAMHDPHGRLVADRGSLATLSLTISKSKRLNGRDYEF